MRNGSRSKRAKPARFANVSRVLRTSELGKRIATLKDNLAQQADQHPVRTTAIALGAGYLLGGGLFSRFTARLLGAGMRVGLRLAVVPAVTQSILDLGVGMFSPSGSASGDDDADSPEPRTVGKSRHPDQSKKETHS